MDTLPLAVVRSNLSSLVRKAARGATVGVTVRGKIAAYLVPASSVEKPAGKAARLRGSLKLRRSLSGSREDFLQWLHGEG